MRSFFVFGIILLLSSPLMATLPKRNNPNIINEINEDCTTYRSRRNPFYYILEKALEGNLLYCNIAAQFYDFGGTEVKESRPKANELYKRAGVVRGTILEDTLFSTSPFYYILHDASKGDLKAIEIVVDFYNLGGEGIPKNPVMAEAFSKKLEGSLGKL